MSDDWNERAADVMFPDDMKCGCECGHHRWNFAANVQQPPIWNPYGDLNQAALLEAEVMSRGRGLPRVYLHHLSQKIGIAPEMDAAEIRWLYATATPAQRTEAAVLTLEGDRPEGGEG